MTPEQNNPSEPEKAPELTGPDQPAHISVPMKEVYDQWAGAAAPVSAGTTESGAQKSAAITELELLSEKRAQGHVVDLARLKELSEIVDEERAKSEER